MPTIRIIPKKSIVTPLYDFILPKEQWKVICQDVWNTIITSTYCGMSYLRASERISQFGSQIGSYFEPLLEDRLQAFGFIRIQGNLEPDFIYPSDRRYDFELKTGKGKFPATNKSTVSGTTRKHKATYMLYVRYINLQLDGVYLGKPEDHHWNIPVKPSVQIATLKSEYFYSTFVEVYKRKG